MKSFLRGGAILAIACRAVALCVGGSIFGLIAPEPHSFAKSTLLTSQQKGRILTFADRVAYQYAIEEVYWRHRIWPKENLRPKPSLDEVMSRAQIEGKVEDYLRNSQALGDYWQRPITPEQLQGEMERMASHTKQPEVLREIFAALGNDPFVIAECLARPKLAERILAQGKGGSSAPPLDGKTNREAITTFWPSAVSNIARGAADPPDAYRLPEISVPLDCTDDTWTPTSTTNAPSSRDFHTTVWTGSEMIVWGGGGGLNTGGRYNPSTDSWTPTSTTNAPTGRYLHTAVWTGSEMVVWGGFNGSYLNTGGKYNPGTDSWTAIRTINAPAGRRLHTAVWTGSEMIIWGGDDGFNYLNTGGKYNPGTDSWIATSTTNAPAGREHHTAVWTGSEMVIWGGEGAGILNNGGRYNSTADSWTATTVSNAPVGRYFHTSVWTGSEMIIWGGDDVFDNHLNTGGKYNPGTDSWITISTTDAPAGRRLHTAVWTGSEMIVWGGAGSQSYTNTGGRYNPTTNNWRATSTTNAVPRADHTAVWTGSEMIVWGGYNGSYLNTGGRYCALSVPVIQSTGSTVEAESCSPPNGAIDPGETVTVSFCVRNIGLSNTANLVGTLQATGGVTDPSGPQNYGVVTAGGSAVCRNFTFTADPNSLCRATLVATIHFQDGATDLGNVTYTFTLGVAGAVALSEGFNDITTLVGAGWFMQNNSQPVGATGWFQGNVNVFNAQGGPANSYIAADYNNGSGLATISNWLLTPTVTLQNGAQLVFWTRTVTASTFPDRLQVRMSTNGSSTNVGSTATDVGDFTTLVLDINPTYTTTGYPDTWTQFTVTLTGVPSATMGRLAFRYFVENGGPNGANSQYIGIDTVSYTGPAMCCGGAPTVTSVVSRKTHGTAGSFDVPLPLTGTPGVECRSGGGTNDFTMVVTFAGNVTVTGSPQAEVTEGTGVIGSGGISNGGMVTVSGNIVTIPLTNVSDQQTISVTLNGVNSASIDQPAVNLVIPMSRLLCDTTGNGAVTSSDVAQTKGRIGQTLNAANFRSDVNTSGGINSSDVTLIKQHLP